VCIAQRSWAALAVALVRQQIPVTEREQCGEGLLELAGFRTSIRPSRSA
jgi:hypothetical protein